ncbi:WXG100 family type VII secretion target [Actinoplanes sp. NPDC049599]|uniref:WXG100-like domain-containing protein n=1 Tax=Actinoplanes sp. NPDC049599 TaxID=3363903 RepID=UPI00379F80C1
MTVNPLIAPRVDEPKSPWAGIWIAEDIELIAQGVQNGNWIDGTLGIAGAGLDGLALVSDPVGALLGYGIAWLIEHVRPLSEALDWLAGDPNRIAAHATTWRNVASSLTEEAEDLSGAVRADLADWSGTAASAYREWAARREQTLRALARASETMGLMTEAAGTLIGTVRLLVRDAVATVVSRLIVYAGELIATAGLATPLVVEQVTTLCAAWGARIARWLKGLIASLRKLGEAMTRLSRNVDDLKNTSPGKGDPEPPRKPAADPKLNEQRAHDLGMDPATGKFRPAEAETALRIEQERGVTLTRAPAESRADWIDEAGRSYDAVGNFPPQFFDQQWPQFSYQMERHLEKADFVPVDVAKFSPEQIARIERFIAERGLAPRVFILGR